MPIPALSLEQLTKRFHDQDAVYSITFEIEPGEIVAVRGSTGSGKTTLLKLAAGLIAPTSGTVKINGDILIPGKRENSYKIGLSIIDDGVYSRLTVSEYLKYFQRLYGVMPENVDNLIRKAGLIDKYDQKLKKLTPNITARVRMARTMIHKPAVLLLDEPTTHLDLETTEILRKMIISSAAEGSAVLITTSSLEEAVSLANRTGLMNKGRLESWDNTEDSAQPSENKITAIPGNHLKIEKIPARVNDRIILFNPLELIYIESQEGQSVLHTAGENFPCPLTLAELEDRLKPFGFFRSHRSYIVNLQRVREVIPWTRNSYSLVLDDMQKTTIPLSKNSIKELEGIIGV